MEPSTTPLQKPKISQTSFESPALVITHLFQGLQRVSSEGSRNKMLEPTRLLSHSCVLRAPTIASSSNTAFDMWKEKGMSVEV
jgi:hypothetical protein